MLDHAFLDVIGALRTTLERSLLERRVAEESLTMDLLLGDLAWETTYALPGEGEAPRITAEITLGWSTWSQASYRSWATGLEDDDPPSVDVEVVLSARDLAHRPDPAGVAAAVGTGPTLGDEAFTDPLPVIEEHSSAEGSRFVVAVERAGTVFLDEDSMKTAERLQAVFEPLGPWLASGLVRLADLGFEFLPPEEEAP